MLPSSALVDSMQLQRSRYPPSGTGDGERSGAENRLAIEDMPLSQQPGRSSTRSAPRTRWPLERVTEGASTATAPAPEPQVHHSEMLPPTVNDSMQDWHACLTPLLIHCACLGTLVGLHLNAAPKRRYDKQCLQCQLLKCTVPFLLICQWTAVPTYLYRCYIKSQC